MSAKQSGIKGTKSEIPTKGTGSITRSRALQTNAETAMSVNEDSVELISTKRKHKSGVEDSPNYVPAKRSKLLQLIKHPDYWYDDGNVVIAIDDTQFKLYRGQLSSHSTYFMELFRGPHPLPDCYVDWNPLYIVGSTNVKDFEALLNAMKDTVGFVIDSWPSHHIVASILRASTTLSFPRFRELCIHILQKTWPRELDSYDNSAIPFAADTIILAKQYRVPNVLKRAYYELLTNADMNQEPSSYTKLPSEDLYLLVETRNILLHEWMSLIAVSSLQECPTESETPQYDALSWSGRKKKWYKIIYESGLAEEWTYDPITGIDNLIGAKWATDEFCTKCIKKMKSEWQEKKEELWEKLDEWLHIKETEAQFAEPSS